MYLVINFFLANVTERAPLEKAYFSFWGSKRQVEEDWAAFGQFKG